MQISSISGEIFEGMLERIEEHVELLKKQNELLATIAAHLGTISTNPPQVTEIVHAISGATEERLHEALGLVRLVLDTGGPGLPGSPNAERLFEAEHLLSRELGNPIWEGRAAR